MDEKTKAIVLLALLPLVSYVALGQMDSPSAPYEKVDWWKKTNFYHIYLRSFQDSNGDGNGDLRGVIQRLDYLEKIQVGTILMAPFYSSPMKDCGYDIDDYRSINPMFGTMDDFDELIREVHKRGMRMVVDFVPNHSSDKHKWFIFSEMAYQCPQQRSRYKDYYVWVKPTLNSTGQPDLTKPPNNWISVFGGGSAWEFSHIRKEWYLHQFLPEQPDLNFQNPEVRKEFKDIARFWLRRGADGLRVDSAIHVYEDPEMRDEPENKNYRPGQDDPYDRLDHIYTKSMSESAALVKDWRDVMEEPEFLDKATGKSTKIIITEAYAPIPKLLEYYGQPDKRYADMPFNFQLFYVFKENWTPKGIQSKVMEWLKGAKDMAWPDEDGTIMPWSNWVTGNHDNSRMFNRAGSPEFAAIYKWLSYILPGVPINYAGDEMFLRDTNKTDIPEKTLEEGEPTRMRFRAPMAWDKSEPAGGFSTTSDIWMALNQDWRQNNVKTLLEETSSVRYNPLKDFINLQIIRNTYRSVFLFGDLVFYDTDTYSEGLESKLLALARLSEYGNIMLVANLDTEKPAKIRLGTIAKTVYKDQTVAPPTEGTIMAINNCSHLYAECIREMKINLKDAELAKSQAMLIRF